MKVFVSIMKKVFLGRYCFVKVGVAGKDSFLSVLTLLIISNV